MCDSAETITAHHHHTIDITKIYGAGAGVMVVATDQCSHLEPLYSSHS